MADAYDDPAMKQAYESTGESMRKISGATKSGGKGRKYGRARKQAREIAKLRKALDAVKAGSRFGGVPGFLAGTVVSAAAFPILERLIYGSREQQMREQFDLQRKLEMEQMGASGDMGGMAPGMGGGQDARMYDLVSDFDRSRKDLEFADVRNRALGRVGSPSGTRDLENLFAGQEARIRSIQSPRQMTPYEVMEIIGG
jgi:hypothetical protein